MHSHENKRFVEQTCGLVILRFGVRYRADCHASDATRLTVLPALAIPRSGNNDSAHVATPNAPVTAPYRLLWDNLQYLEL